MEVKRVEIEKGYGKCGIGRLVFYLADGEKRILEVDELLRFIDEISHRIGELERKNAEQSMLERFRQTVAKVWKSIRKRIVGTWT